MSETTAVATTKPKMDSVEGILQHYEQNINTILPKFFAPERFVTAAIKLLKQLTAKDGLKAYDARSIVIAMLDCASLGLDPNPLLGQAYFVPFNEKNNPKKLLQMIPGYKGLQNMALRSGKVTAVYGVVVYANDVFEYEQGTNPKLLHKPTLNSPRGEMVCAYGVAVMIDGTYITRVVHKEEIMKAKGASKAGASSYSPWTTWPEEMWRKTAIRRLCKDLPLSPEIERATALEDLADAGKRTRDYSDLPEAEFEEVEETAQTSVTEDLAKAAEGAKADSKVQGTLL